MLWMLGGLPVDRVWFADAQPGSPLPAESAGRTEVARASRSLAVRPACKWLCVLASLYRRGDTGIGERPCPSSCRAAARAGGFDGARRASQRRVILRLEVCDLGLGVSGWSQGVYVRTSSARCGRPRDPLTAGKAIPPDSK